MPSEAAALGMTRAGVCGFFFLSILLTSFSDLARLPSTIMRPTGAMQVFSWRFYDALLTPAGMLTLKCLLLVSLLAATVGFMSDYATKSSALLVLFYEGLLRSFGHFNHDEMPAVYILLVLAFSPCGDAFSVDGWAKSSRARRRGFVYGYPVLLMRALLAWSYFSSGLIKLRVAGLGYVSPDTLPTLAVTHSLDNLHDTHFRLAFLLPRHREFATVLVGLVLLWELSFPLAIWSRLARRVILTAGVFFHLGTLFFMNIFFPFHLAMYLVFVDWPAVAQRLGRLELLRRVVGARVSEGLVIKSDAANEAEEKAESDNH
ncbi:MAG: HTTM domain-containing protein [Rubrivivax sp.]|nr:HTTM domain-containing protein [Pyrinomonadaceae bacterium]